MEPGRFSIRSWIQPFEGSPSFPDTLTIYDAGDIQGWYIQEASGKTSWILFSIASRSLLEDGTVTETTEILHETAAPLYYYSIETYPLRRVRQHQHESSQFLFSLPQVRILLTVSEPLLELEKPPLQEQPLQPSPLPQQLHGVPGSHGPLKSSSSRLIDGQPQFQHKNKTLPKPKA